MAVPTVSNGAGVKQAVQHIITIRLPANSWFLEHECYQRMSKKKWRLTFGRV